MTKTTQKQSAKEQMYGSFYLGTCEFAIPAARIEQVVDLPSRSVAVPNSPDFVRCTFNLRGTVITVVDLEKLFGNPKTNKETTLTGSESVAVLEHEGQCIGVLFETTGEVFRGVSEEFSEFDKDTRNEFVKGVFKRRDGERLVQVLDVEGLFKVANVPRDASRGRSVAETSHYHDRGAKSQYMTFVLGETICALPIETIQEVFEIESIEKTVFTGGSCLGLTKLRGGTLPIMDFEALLGSRPALQGEALKDHSIIVMQRESELFGLLVDSIAGLTTAYEEEIVPFPTQDLLRSDVFHGCIIKDGVEDVIVFDHKALLQKEEISEITKVHGKVAESPLRQLSKTNEKTKGLKETYVTFTTDSHYAVDIKEIQEIIELPDELLQPPGLSDCFSGIVNLRGQDIVAIVDLRNRWSESMGEEGSEGQVMIFDANGGKAGLVVDSVDSIISIQENEKISFPDPAGAQEGASTRFITTINFKDADNESRSAIVVEMQWLLENSTGNTQFVGVC
jgi:purine-binding chemotaxis protein CheW